MVRGAIAPDGNGFGGAPTVDALSEAVGQVQLSLDKGQVVGLNPGAGRVLGLTSVAALRRRLALDFSDMTDKGLAFDTVRGDFDLREGSAYTENLLVKGPAAEIATVAQNSGDWGVRLTPAHCHSCKDEWSAVGIGERLPALRPFVPSFRTRPLKRR